MLENLKANIKTHVVPLKIILLGTLFRKSRGGFYFGCRIGYWGPNIALFLCLKGMFVMTRFIKRLSSLAKYVRQKCLLSSKSLIKLSWKIFNPTYYSTNIRPRKCGKSKNSFIVLLYQDNLFPSVSEEIYVHDAYEVRIW